MNSLPISDNIKLLSQQIKAEVNKFSQDGSESNNKTDSLVYVGNWQDAIPRSIWFDTSLSDSDVRSWGVIRIQAVNGSAVMLSLNKLLEETLGYSSATVSRILYVLRLTRWISLCSTLRSENGKFKGNIYAIHDSPVLLKDAIYLDSQYIEFVKNQATHNNKSIRTLSQSIWQVISESVYQDNFIGETETSQSLNKLMNPDKKQYNPIHVYNLNMDETHHVQNLNMDTKHHVQFLNMDDEKNEVIENQQDSIHVQNLNMVPICSSSSSSSSSFNKLKEIKEKTTTTNSEGISLKEKFEIQKDLIYPKEFNQNEIILAEKYLKLVETEEQQNYLDELAAKIKTKKNTSNPVDNNIALFAWLCKEHAKGNICLTSGYLKHQEQRKRKLTRDNKLKEKQQAMTEAALQGGNVKNIAMNDTKKSKNNKTMKIKEKRKASRWEGINHAVVPK